MCYNRSRRTAAWTCTPTDMAYRHQERPTANDMNESYTRIARNSIFSIVRFVVLLPLPIIILPFMLTQLGDVAFGLWALFATFITYTQLADFGMGLALTKYVAAYAAKAEWHAVLRATNTVFFFYTAVALGLGLLLAGLSPFLTRLIPAGSALSGELLVTLIALAYVTFAINLTFGAFGSVLQGLQRLDLTNLVSFMATAGLYLGIVAVLTLGHGLAGILVLSALLALATAVVQVWLVYRLVPGYRLRIAAFDRTYLRTILGYSLNVQGGTLAALLFDPATKLILTRAVGVASVTQYEVGTRITTQLRNLFAVALLPLFPGVSHMEAGEGHARVEAVYRRSARYVVIFGLPAYLLLIIVAPWLLNAWLGPGYEPASMVMRIMTLGWFVSLVAMPSYFILQALGHARLCMMTHVVQGVLNVGLALVLARLWGFTGVTLAAFVALVVGSTLVIAGYARVMPMTLRAMLGVVPWRVVVVVTILGAGVYVILSSAAQVTLLGLIVICLVYGAVYGGLLLVIRAFNQADWNLLRSLLPPRWAARAPAQLFRSKSG